MPYQPTPSAQNAARKKAEVGMGRKGHYSPGIYTTPLSMRWRAEEKIIFEVKIPHALNLYRAAHGHFPKTQEEFVREILEYNHIDLPELPPGQEYVYDPQKGELQVATTAKPQPGAPQ
jgi:hypothetical protein